MVGCFPGSPGKPAVPDVTPAPDVTPDTKPEPAPEPAPIPQAGLFGFDVSLPPLFAGKPDAAERKVRLAAVARELAAQLKFDGEQSDPLVQTTTQALDKLQVMNTYAFRGEVVAPPGFVNALKAVATAQLEADGEGKALDEQVDGKTYRQLVIDIVTAIATVLDPQT